MARPVKQGLDYFPMDVTTDDKFELIEAKHGIEGFGIIIKLFQKIYREGCYLEWNEDKLLIFKKNINVDINVIKAVINDAIVYKIFDSTLYKKYNVLTSSGIQKRFLSACDRRKSVDLIKNYIIVDINSINVCINWINTNIGTQSKVKEIKEEEIEIREKQFYEKVQICIFDCRPQYIEYQDEINNFCSYWTEHGEKDKKLRFEKETTYQIEKRLDYWFRNKLSSNQNKFIHKPEISKAAKTLSDFEEVTMARVNKSRLEEELLNQ